MYGVYNGCDRQTDRSKLPTHNIHVPGKDVSTEDTSNDIAKVRDVIHVRKSTCDQDIPLSGKRKAAGMV